MASLSRTLPSQAIPQTWAIEPALSKTGWLTLMLFLLCFFSAIAIIEVKDQNRRLVSEQQSLRQEAVRLQVAFGQLLLEEGSLCTHARSQQVATHRLHMYLPNQKHMVYLRNSR
jgi:cell division protein FtsL